MSISTKVTICLPAKNKTIMLENKIFTRVEEIIVKIF